MNAPPAALSASVLSASACAETVAYTVRHAAADAERVARRFPDDPEAVAAHMEIVCLAADAAGDVHGCLLGLGGGERHPILQRVPRWRLVLAGWLLNTARCLLARF